MKNIISTLLLTNFILFAFNYSYAQYDQKAKSILDAMSAKYKSINSFKAKFSYDLKSASEGINESFTGVITVKGDKYHIDLEDQETYNDGVTVWTYLKEENEVTITDYEPDPDDPNPANIYDMYKSGFKYVLVEEKVVNGAKCHIIDLNPEDKNRSFFKIRLAINKSDKIVRHWELHEKSGRVFQFIIKDFNSKAIVTDQNFVFNEKKYPDVETIDLKN